MPKGISIHVGVNRAKLAGLTIPQLRGCENDAMRMHEIAIASGFNREEPFKSEALFLSEAAKYDAVIAAIERASSYLEAEDFFLFTFSGHGTRKGTNDSTEPDRKDESIVLHDRLLLDDVFKLSLWPMFKEGVKVLAISDCCHGGGVFFLPENGMINSNAATSPQVEVAEDIVAPINGTGVEEDDRVLSAGEKNMHVAELQPFYDEIRANLPSSPPPIKASVLILGACEPGQKAKDGFPNGAFTKALLEAARFNPPPDFRLDPPPDYEQLHAAIVQNLNNGSQTPVLISIGEAPPFTARRPFAID